MVAVFRHFILMNRSFLRILAAGAITVFVISVISLIVIATQSSIALLVGGVNTLPEATVFVPKQAPAMVSLQANPEKLYGVRQVNLALQKRHQDHQEWLQWITGFVNKIGLDYETDLKPWLGDEITLGITALDFDRNLDNGIQPGYLLAVSTKNPQMTQELMRNFYAEQSNISIEEYKGANIISQSGNRNKIEPDVWANAIVGKFVLFANHGQILKEAINQAQAVNLNLAQSEYYQDAIANIKQPHIAIAYLNVPRISAWLDQLGVVAQPNRDQTLSATISISKQSLAVQTSLNGVDDSTTSKEIYKSLIHNTELQQFFDSLSLENPVKIDLTTKPSLSQSQIPRYEVTRLALKSMFSHLEAIKIKNNQDNNGKGYNLLFKLDSQ